jgi:hypothetical protein
VLEGRVSFFAGFLGCVEQQQLAAFRSSMALHQLSWLLSAT